MTNPKQTRRFQQTYSITIDDITVQLIFASESNHEIPLAIRDMLKKSYLQRQAI